MPKKKTLTVAELKSLLIARFNAERPKQEKFQARLQQELGNEVQEKKPEYIEMENQLVDWISDILARRLKRNRRTTPLLSSRDLARFIPFMLNMIAHAEGDELDVELHKVLEKFLKTMFNVFLEVMHSKIPPGKNIYEEHWRWINTVLALADESSVLPTELLALEEATDEITRRMFSKKQFVALFKKAMNKFTDVDMLKKSLIQPILDMVSEGDGEKRLDMERELEEALMPQLREIFEKSKLVANAWLNEEIKRIYAAA